MFAIAVMCIVSADLKYAARHRAEADVQYTMGIVLLMASTVQMAMLSVINRDRKYCQDLHFQPFLANRRLFVIA